MWTSTIANSEKNVICHKTNLHWIGIVMYLITSAIYWLDEKPLKEVSCRCFNVLHPFKFHFISLKCLVKQVIKLKSKFTDCFIYLDFISLKGTLIQFRNFMWSHGFSLHNHFMFQNYYTICHNEMYVFLLNLVIQVIKINENQKFLQSVPPPKHST